MSGWKDFLSLLFLIVDPHSKNRNIYRHLIVYSHKFSSLIHLSTDWWWSICTHIRHACSGNPWNNYLLLKQKKVMIRASLSVQKMLILITTWTACDTPWTIGDTINDRKEAGHDRPDNIAAFRVIFSDSWAIIIALRNLSGLNLLRILMIFHDHELTKPYHQVPCFPEEPLILTVNYINYRLVRQVRLSVLDSQSKRVWFCSRYGLWLVVKSSLQTKKINKVVSSGAS